MTRPNLASLVAGLSLTAIGVLLVMATEDAIDLRPGYFWPAMLAAAGATLLASDVARRRR